MTKICFVSLPSYGFYNPSTYEKTGGGGAKRQIYLLSKELAKTNQVATIVGDYGQPQHETRAGVDLYRAYTPNSTPNHIAIRKLYSAMKRADSDIYVYRGNSRKATIVGAITALLGRKFVYHVANDVNVGSLYESRPTHIRLLFQYLLRRSHQVVAQTDYQKEAISSKFGVSSVVIPNGYPPRSSSSQDDEFFLWVGRIEKEQKKPHLFLDLATKLPEFEFTMIGPASNDQYHNEIINKANKLDNVSYLGTVSPDEIAEYYDRAIALVNTSAYEGFPNTFLEAWRCGVPVVSLNVDPSRFLKDGLYDGYADSDLDKATNLLRNLYFDADFRSKVGLELRQYFREEYTISSVSDRYSEHVINA